MWLIYTLLSRRSPRIHPSRRRQPLAHKWYVHVLYWFSVLVAQAEGWAGQTQQAVVKTRFCQGSTKIGLVWSTLSY